MLFEWSSIHTVLKMTNGRELCLFPCRGVCLIYPVSRWNRGCRCWMQCHVTVLCFYVHHPWSLSTGGRGGSDFHQKKRKKKESAAPGKLRGWHRVCISNSLSFSCGFVDKNICAQVFKKKMVGRCCLCVCGVLSVLRHSAVPASCVYFLFNWFDMVNTRATRRNNLLLILEPEERGDEVFLTDDDTHKTHSCC